jgi:hypothetical protein
VLSGPRALIRRNDIITHPCIDFDIDGRIGI